MSRFLPHRYLPVERWRLAGSVMMAAGLCVRPVHAQLEEAPSAEAPSASATGADQAAPEVTTEVADAPVAESTPPDPASESDDAGSVPADEVVSDPSESSSDTDAVLTDDVSSGAGLFEQSVSVSTPAPAGATEAPQPTFDLNGYVRSDFFVGRGRDAESWELKASYSELALRLRTQRESYGDAFAETRLEYGLLDDDRQLKFQLREAYVNAYVGPFDLRLGHQIVVWGRADAFNPTNNLTPLDLRVRSPLEHDRRLANLGARAFLNLAPFRIEGIWLPLYRASEVPTVMAPSYVDFRETNNPSPSLQNGTGAARVHLELPAMEASVSYLFGYAPLPGLALNGITEGTQVGGSVIVEERPIRIERRPYDQHVFGLDFSTAIGELMTLRGEAAVRAPLHYKRRAHAANPDIQYALGADRAFGSVSVIAQYMGRLVLDWQRAESPEFSDDPAALGTGVPAAAIEQAVPLIESELRVRNQMLFSQLHEVQHLITARVEWLALHDTLSLSAFGFVNFTTKEWLAFPKLAYQISDSLSTSVGAEIFAGPDGTLLGLIDRQLSAGYAELRYGF